MPAFVVDPHGTDLVVGGSGFIGSHLVAGLMATGRRVRSFDRAPPKPGIAALPGVEFIRGDFADLDQLRYAVDGCDTCFHLLSTTVPKNSNDDPIADWTSNVAGTLRLLDLCRAAQVRKVVYLSSGGTVYGPAQYAPIDEAHATDPLCAYGISRLSIEKYLELYRVLHGLDYCVLRAANPYGPGQDPRASQGAIGVFLGRILAGDGIDIWGDGSVVRDFIYVEDVVRAMLLAARYAGPRRVLNIGSDQGCSLRELLETLGVATQRRLAVRYLPGLPFDVPVNVLDIGAARAALQWEPTTDLATGLQKTWASFNVPAPVGAG